MENGHVLLIRSWIRTIQLLLSHLLSHLSKIPIIAQIQMSQRPLNGREGGEWPWEIVATFLRTKSVEISLFKPVWGGGYPMDPEITKLDTLNFYGSKHNMYTNIICTQ